MIKIKESKAFSQVISAVINDGHVLSLRAGEITDHEERCARYHAKKCNQDLILVQPLCRSAYHIEV